jgi:Cu-Zn family superoxide dismutase
MMQSRWWSAAVLLGLTALAAMAAEWPRKSASAQLKNAQGEVVGVAHFKQTAKGALMRVKVSHLPQGVHAIHIHAVGKCEAPNFTSAGGHFNPAHKQHGLMNPEGHHAGDMPNLTVNAKGNATYHNLLEGVTLEGTGDTSLFHEGGTAVVIHEKADDMKSDPAGNAGARMVCGVIE